MAQGPENRMLARLKPKLEADLGVEIEKTNNIFRSGRPDWDVFGEGGMCGFIEAKHWKRQMPVGSPVVTETIFDMCSPLQQRWLIRKLEMGQKVAMLCGFETRGSYAFVPFELCGYTTYRLSVDAVDYNGLAQQIKQWLYNHVEKETL